MDDTTQTEINRVNDVITDVEVKDIETELKNSAGKFQLRLDISKNYIQKYSMAFLVLLGLISVFEIAMTVRLLAIGDLSVWYRVGYLISYISLFAVSAGTFAAVLYNRKKGTIYKALYFVTQAYGEFIILWSFFITSVDIYKGNTMIVFLTIIMVISVVLRMDPVIYTVFVVPFSVILVWLAHYFGSPLVISNGYTINFCVFIIFAVALSFIQDRITRRSFIARRELEHLSYCDQLTGVYNRHSLQKHIREMSDDSIFFFGVVDADNFKHVNDSFGHNIGDSCLKSIARLLVSEFGEQVYRYGGDEFVVITTHRESDLISGVARINEQLSKDYTSGAIHISAGFYCPVSRNEDYKDYFKKADEALYRAKNTGKSKAEIYVQPL